MRKGGVRRGGCGEKSASGADRVQDHGLAIEPVPELEPELGLGRGRGQQQQRGMQFAAGDRPPSRKM